MKLLKLLLCGLLLLAIEYIVLLICIHAEDVIFHSGNITKWKHLTIWSHAIRGANEISAVRFILYFPFWFIGMPFLFRKVSIKYPALKLAVTNCLLYILTSVLMILFFPFAIEYFHHSFFFYLVGATFISPFIAYYIFPFFKNLISKL